MDFVLAMRQGNKGGFKLRGGKVYALLNHAVKVTGEHFCIALGCGVIVANVVYPKENSEHRTHLVHTGFYFSLTNDIAQSLGQHVSKHIQPLIGSGGVNEL